MEYCAGTFEATYVLLHPFIKAESRAIQAVNVSRAREYCQELRARFVLRERSFLRLQPSTLDFAR